MSNIDQVVRQTLNMPMEQVLTSLNNAPNLFIIWSRYREKWRSTFPSYQQLLSKGPTSTNYRVHSNAIGSTCMRTRLFDTITAFLRDDPDPSLAKVDKVVNTCLETLSCSRCSVVESDEEWKVWRVKVGEAIRALPKWEDFV
ncbi:hypothetical protein K435DRAFT_913138 [Dendrothele bispora CBS 962.96]|uniref:Uncharacterized protein n=1 Tax=Dendrothele bispora (strain CBS 962.96) TaxID=1314807 RepID=A0A4S8KIW1_DENBC|nr:hypothetical protein K435DRAFT_913138 [Dendrothele bispora CBS 962.96]